MIEHTPPTPAPVASTDSRGDTPSGMPSPWGWRVCASAIVLGLVLAIACLAAGLLALWLLTTAESIRLLSAQGYCWGLLSCAMLRPDAGFRRRERCGAINVRASNSPRRGAIAPAANNSVVAPVASA